jgi:hypothetical protein
MSSCYIDYAETTEQDTDRRESIAAEDEDFKPEATFHNTGDNFPVKLHYMLSEIERDGLNHIVSWQPHGRCFVVHRKKEFEEKLLPLYVSLFAFIASKGLIIFCCLT